MKRPVLVIVAFAGLAAVVYGVDASGDSGHAARGDTISLTIHWTAQHQVDAPPAGDSPGDLSVVAGDALTRGGRNIGRAQGVCVNVPPKNSECSFTLALPGGHLQLLSGYGAGFSGQTAGVDAIVGGTGAYQSARGEATDRETGPNTVEVTLHVLR